MSPAAGQGFFQRLFNLNEPTPPPQQAAPAPTQPRVVTAPAPVVEKDEDAAVLLVVGDFLARGLADALADAFADEPGLIVVDRTNGSSGIVRDDFYDWRTVLPELIAELDPTYLVMMIGTNDRQTIRQGGAFDLRSAEWDRIYAERVNALAAEMSVLGGNAFWVGQPPMRSRAMSADMAFFNTVYQSAAGAQGITFVDIWDAFADQDGRFTSTGPDVAGQNRVLRADDGFSFTRAGREKVAFFVEAEIDLTVDAGGFVAVPGAAGVEVTAAGEEVRIGPVLVLGAPPPGAPAELLTEVAVPAEESPAQRFLLQGEALPTVAGRADNFTWPGEGEAEAEPEPEAAVLRTMPGTATP